MIPVLCSLTEIKSTLNVWRMKKHVATRKVISFNVAFVAF